MKISNFWLLASGFWLLAAVFTLYSYSQIDLNLTLSSNFLYQSFQQQMIKLGYFNRPLSAFIYLILVILLFANYYLLIVLTKKGKLVLKQIWILIIGAGIILLFAYPAFSHDIFNYIFDVRILIFHKASPWMHTALDFPLDPWTRFMHWTHRTYPYGPFWIIAGIIPYTLGFGKFVLTLFNFKLFFLLSYLGSSWLVYKILSRVSKKNSLLGLAFFAFNPLVLNESIVSPHLDIVMVFLGLLAIYLILIKKKALGVFSLLLSILTKYATIGYIPIVFFKMKPNTELYPAKFQKKLYLMIGLTFAAILGQIYIREILPWYFLPLIALLVLSSVSFLKIILWGISLGGVLYYLPFIYIGEYISQVETLRTCLFLIPILLSIVSVILNACLPADRK